MSVCVLSPPHHLPKHNIVLLSDAKQMQYRGARMNFNNLSLAIKSGLIKNLFY